MKRLKPNTEKVTSVTTGVVKYVDIRTWRFRKRWWTKARVPGTVRPSRMPGGCGYRGDKLWEGG